MLSKDKIIELSHQAKIHIQDSEVEEYQIKLNERFKEIEKLNYLNIDSNTKILVSPNEEECVLKDDVIEDIEDLKKALKNTNGDYIEVVNILNE